MSFALLDKIKQIAEDALNRGRVDLSGTNLPGVQQNSQPVQWQNVSQQVDQNVPSAIQAAVPALGVVAHAPDIVDVIKGFFAKNAEFGNQHGSQGVIELPGQPKLSDTEKAKLLNGDPNYKYVPQNKNQELGANINNFLADFTSAQNGGINDAFSKGTESLIAAAKASPLLNSIVDAAKTKTASLFTKGAQTAADNAAPAVADNVTPALTDTAKGIVPPPDVPTPTVPTPTTPTVDPLQPGDVFQPKGIIKKTAESLFGNSSLEGSKGVIAKSGPAGEAIVNLLDQADQMASHTAGDATAKLEQALGTLKGNELTSFADVAEGKIPAVSQAQKTAVEVWKTIASDVATKAKTAGIDMGNITNYFPHQTLPMSPAEEKAFAQTLVDSGKFNNVSEALQSLKQETSSLGRTAPRRFGNLELSRGGNLPYNKSPNVLLDYVKNAYGRIADVTHFGANDQNLYDLAKAAGTQGGDTGQISQYLDQILGKNQTSSGLGQKLTSLQTVTKLNPMTSVTNLTQSLSTMLRTDIPTVVNTIGDIVKNPGEAFANATKVGEISADMSKQLADYTGGGNVVGKWIRLIGMNGTEKFNRVLAVNSGMKYAEKLAADGGDAALRELERLGVDVSKITADGTLPQDQLLEAGRRLSRATQFSTKAGELPYAWKTEAGKVITQFKSFAYKQTGFLKNEAGRVGSEAIQGNVKPLINALATFGIATPIAGEIVNDFKSLLKNKQRQDTGSLAERYISNILGATSFGLLDSTGAIFGQYGQGGVIGAVGGPTVSDAQKIAQGAGDLNSAAQGNKVDLKPDLRNLVKEIPGAGQTLSNTFIPNSSVNNFVGVNNGLSTKNNDAYLAMKQTDPLAAEKFKQENQQVNQPAPASSSNGGNFLEKLFGGGKQSFDWNTAPTTKKAKTAYNTQVDTALANGANIPDTALNQRYFDGKTYDQGNNGDKAKIMKSALTVSQDQYLTDAQKQSIIASAKVNPDDMSYYKLASQNETDKVSQMMDFVNTNQLSHDQLINVIALNKRRVAGAYIATPAVIDELYNNNLISKQDKALLTAIKWDSVYNKFYMDRNYKGDGGGAMTAAQKRSYINSINTIFKPVKKTSKKTLSILPQAPKMTTLSPLSG